uniref:Uncharacterized protein n=1 Tax=Arundo donax TaxID=35708 RepID=A0A0A9CCC1_ARUDO
MCIFACLNCYTYHTEVLRYRTRSRLFSWVVGSVPAVPFLIIILVDPIFA